MLTVTAFTLMRLMINVHNTAVRSWWCRPTHSTAAASRPSSLFRESGLPKDSVADVSRILTINRTLLKDLVSQLTNRRLAQVLGGIDVVLGRAR